jgi:hypothetical protein
MTAVMTGGLITVNPDGTYSAIPALGPFGVPSTSTSLAQAIFEQWFPVVIGNMPASTQAQITNASTTPPTTVKGKVMSGLAAQVNAIAFGMVGYLSAGTSVSLPIT